MTYAHLEEDSEEISPQISLSLSLSRSLSLSPPGVTTSTRAADNPSRGQEAKL